MKTKPIAFSNDLDKNVGWTNDDMAQALIDSIDRDIITMNERIRDLQRRRYALLSLTLGANAVHSEGNLYNNTEQTDEYGD